MIVEQSGTDAGERLRSYLPTEGGDRPSAVEWPIAAAMLQAPARDSQGRPMADADGETWERILRVHAAEGFDGVEISSNWIDLTAMSAPRRAELRTVAEAAGVAPRGVLIASRSVIAPDGEANLAYGHAVIDAAAEIGSPVVCVGLHEIDPRRPGDPLWFWTVDNPRLAHRSDQWGEAVSRFRELGRHAESVGLEVSLEMYPGTFLGGGEMAVRLHDDIASPAVGLNPDLGNFVRVQGPVEEWSELAAATLPRTNYWHVKNYGRSELPDQGLVMTQPMPLESGMIDYRKAVGFAVEVGFTGTIIVEHYGGDGLSVSAANREYLRRILPGGSRA